MTTPGGTPTEQTSDHVRRSISRLGSLASPALLLAISTAVLATVSWAMCESERPPAPPPDVPDGGAVDAAVSGRDATLPDAAVVGPAPGASCQGSLDCAPPATICCAGVCLSPSVCM